MKRVKIISAAFLIAIVSVPVIISVVLQLSITLNRIETARQLEKNYLQVIHLKIADAKWVRTGEEIIINDEFFDVQKVTKNGEYLVVTGIFDKAETFLQQKLDNLYKQKKDGQNLVLAKYLQLICCSYFDPINAEEKIPVLQSTNYNKLICPRLNDIVVLVPQPPPKA